MHWLSGFRGFRAADFKEEGQARRRGRLFQLAGEIQRADGDEPLGVVDHREQRGGFDIDFYLGDQFRLIGNTGIASWSDDSLVVKLVVGSLAVYTTDEHKEAISTASGCGEPLFRPGPTAIKATANASPCRSNL